MAATTVGIVYSSVSGMKRRVIFPDYDNQLTDGAFALTPGEAQLIVTRRDFDALGDDACLLRHYARVLPLITELPSVRCVVVDINNNKVVDVIAADPAVDSLPGRALINHAVADIDWTLVKGAFVAPVKAPVL